MVQVFATDATEVVILLENVLKMVIQAEDMAEEEVTEIDHSEEMIEIDNMEEMTETDLMEEEMEAEDLQVQVCRHKLSFSPVHMRA